MHGTMIKIKNTWIWYTVLQKGI